MQQKTISLQQKLSGLDQDYCYTDRDLNSVKESNSRLLDQSHHLQQEMSALRQYIDLLNLQNTDLQKELDEFVRTEELLRSGLDRKARVQQI